MPDSVISGGSSASDFKNSKGSIKVISKNSSSFSAMSIVVLTVPSSYLLTLLRDTPNSDATSPKDNSFSFLATFSFSPFIVTYKPPVAEYTQGLTSSLKYSYNVCEFIAGMPYL